MCRANLNCLVGFITTYLDQPKLLSVWKEEYNNNPLTKKRLTNRELAFAFRVIKSKEIFNVERPNPNSYLFSVS